VLPAERGEVSEELVRDILGLAQSGDGAIEVPRVSGQAIFGGFRGSRRRSVRGLSAYATKMDRSLLLANPAHAVRGPSHIVTTGQTPVLDPVEARALLDSIDTSTPAGLRDRALIGLMVYSFARIGAALGMAVEDVYTQNRRLWVRLREKGGKRHAMPCHHNLEEYLTAYLDGAGLRDDPKGPLFRTIGRGTGKLTRTVLPQANAYAMIRRRAAAAGIETKLGNHSFRATGITAYLKNGGTLEKAAAMANHASTRTTQLYDRRRDEVSLDEVERIVI
jgi:integrase